MSHTGAMSASTGPGLPVSIVDADPDLAAGLDGEDRELARRYAVAMVHTLARGPLDLPPPTGHYAPVIGLLVLDGLLARTVELAGRSTTELLGQGDIMHPWDDAQALDPLPGHVAWSVLEPARVAVLDRRFAAVAGRWPVLLEALVGRLIRRARANAVQQATAQVPRVDARLLVLFWSLADRWGRMTPQGVRLGLPLTHQVIGTLIGARRPSVTAAVGALSRRGLVERTDAGWLLHGDPQEALRDLCRPRTRPTTSPTGAKANDRAAG